MSSNPALWDVYARYYEGIGDLHKAVEYRQREVRALQSPGWETNADQFKKVVAGASKLVSVVTRLAETDKSILYPTRLTLRSLSIKSDEIFHNTPEHEQLRQMLATVEAMNN